MHDTSISAYERQSYSIERTHHCIGQQEVAIRRYPEPCDGVCVALEGHGHLNLPQVPDLDHVLNASGVDLVASLTKGHRQDLVILGHGVRTALCPQIPELHMHISVSLAGGPFAQLCEHITLLAAAFIVSTMMQHV